CARRPLDYGNIVYNRFDVW
nr:immunoglobulin heavy chain junction region [Macaca mulatta]MOY19141.1 immunoglobulin heavy chain junction region [Macaca mulatta]MOY19303.1 immunoglobulin heavy chain junction region [Macaca mulatta]MOY19558.1 immunoglobulin heavy chain junction region [Macaca mulatta]MOY20240.1 immunoglobulin heavy chain junction region [Macaca mulatta]